MTHVERQEHAKKIWLSILALRRIYKKHAFKIGGCGCCGSPFLVYYFNADPGNECDANTFYLDDFNAFSSEQEIYNQLKTGGY